MTFVSILIAVLVFSLLVLFHEFGHFIVAKAVGIGVTEFSLGMGPRILSFQKGDTRYSWKAIPFGGSCAMVGEDEDEEKPPANSFNAKPAWARFLVVLAGPAFNVILAFLLSFFLIGMGGINTRQVSSVTRNGPAEKAGIEAWKDSVTSINGKKIGMGRDLYLYTLSHPLDGSEVTLTVERDGEERTVTIDPKISGFRIGIAYMSSDEAAALSSVTEGLPAYQAGLRAGDVITTVNGETIESGKALADYFSAHPVDGSTLTLDVVRGGEKLTLQMTPEPYEAYDLGFQAFFVYKEWDGNVGELLSSSLNEIRYWLSYVVITLKMLFAGQVGVKDLSGPVGIVSTISSAVENGVENGGTKLAFINVLELTVLLSVNLGVMNLLPIPALDGGRILFILFEMIFRKPVPKKAEGIVHLIGFALLMLLMVFILFNDILRLIRG